MAFEIDNENNAGEASEPRQQRTNASTQRDDRASESAAVRGGSEVNMRNMGRSLGRALSRNDTGEVLSKAYSAFDKLLHDQNTANAQVGDTIVLDEYKVFMFDSVEYRSDMSSLVFAYLLKQNNEEHAFYYTLLVEGSAPELSPARCDERNRSFEIPRVAGDVMDQRYSDRIHSMLETFYGTTVKLHDCGANVLPTTIECDDPKNHQVIRNLAFYMNAAIETCSVELLNYQPRFSLNWLESDDSLEVDVDWTNNPQYTATGAPNRTDVKIGITANVREADGVSRDKLSRVGGSFELIYSPAMQSGNGFGGRRDKEETELYTPLFTITNLDTDYKAITLEMQLLGMASTATLSDDLMWVNAFRTTGSKSRNDKEDRDYRDIGALNYLAPQGTYFDIKSANLAPEGFLEYFGTLCRPDLAYAIDVEERGDNSWINSVFIEAAQGVDASLDRIFDAANQLTDNHFSGIYRKMADEARAPSNPFFDTQNRILLGWYKEDGVQQDLRNLDLLYWLNRRGDHDSNFALDWQDTYDQTNIAIEVRIEKRIRLLTDVFGSSGFKVTGYAQQVGIDSTFIAALAAAVKSCNVRIDQSNTTNNYGNVRPRGNYSISDRAGANLGGGLFTRSSRSRDDRDGGGGGGRGGRTFIGRR
jgi:hypothetical protein